MLNRILVACVGIPVILVALFVLPSIFTPILIGVLSAVGTYEALHAIKMNHPRIALYTMLLALAVPFWVYFGEIRHWALLALIIYLILVFLEAFFSGFRVRIERVGSGFFFALLISYCLSSVVSLGNLELRTSYVLLPIALPFVADAAATSAHPSALPKKDRGGRHRRPGGRGADLHHLWPGVLQDHRGYAELLLPGSLRDHRRRGDRGGGPGFLLH